jgi:hypothetical protein
MAAMTVNHPNQISGRQKTKTHLAKIKKGSMAMSVEPVTPINGIGLCRPSEQRARTIAEMDRNSWLVWEVQHFKVTIISGENLGWNRIPTDQIFILNDLHHLIFLWLTFHGTRKLCQSEIDRSIILKHGNPKVHRQSCWWSLSEVWIMGVRPEQSMFASEMADQGHEDLKKAVQFNLSWIKGFYFLARKNDRTTLQN